MQDEVETDKFRSESEIIDDLKRLCTSAGYAQCLALLTLESNLIVFQDEIDAESMSRFHEPDRLLRSEQDLLAGFLIQKLPDTSKINADKLAEYRERTYQLLSEFHDATQQEFRTTFKSALLAGKAYEMKMTGEALREPIFYSGEAAYPFQFRDFAPIRYASDVKWLEENYGFNMADAARVVAALENHQLRKLEQHREKHQGRVDQIDEFLSIYIVRPEDMVGESKVSLKRVEKFFEAFSIQAYPANEAFEGIGDYNEATSKPMFKTGDGYLVFQTHSLAASIYESPFYWMTQDEKYFASTSQSRGKFTEKFVADRLRTVLGHEKVFQNVTFENQSGNRAGEIDVLAIYADRAVLIQAKSKRLTLAARKGSQEAIEYDFEAAVQNAYEQAAGCAALLLDREFRVYDEGGEELNIRRDYVEIFPVCVISDSYPALAHQASLFLKASETECVRYPYVADIFLIDAMCEFLFSPLHLFNFLHRRMKYIHRVRSNNELAILSYHLAHNLWFGDEHDFIDLGDDFSVHLDTSMLVRREGIPGERTPQGILTKLRGTYFDLLLSEVGACEGDRVLELGFHLLAMSEEAANDLSAACVHILKKTYEDGNMHDATLLLGHAGLTIHSTIAPDEEMADRLYSHCSLKKYQCKANRWFGIGISPKREPSLRLAMGLDFKWEYSADLEKATRGIAEKPGSRTLKQALREDKAKRRKVGRNQLCPCGSNRKYKHCCLRNAELTFNTQSK